MIKIYKYPLQRFENDYDYLSIDSIKYTPPRIQNNNGSDNPFSFSSGNNANRGLSAQAKILLPMPTNITDVNVTGWEAGRLNAFDAKLVQGVNGLLNNLKNDGSGKSLQDRLGSSVNEGLQAAGNMADSLTSGENKEATKNYLTSQLVNIIRNTDSGQIVSRQTGKVLNPNLELLFKSVELRNFNFQFDLTPRSKSEMENIKGIIKTLKRDSAAKKGTDGLFLSSPNVFRLKYMKGREEHPFLNKFKICALKSVQIDYTSGTGGYKVYEDSTPVKMSMGLAFTELNPIYNEDYTDSDGVGF